MFSLEISRKTGKKWWILSTNIITHKCINLKWKLGFLFRLFKNLCYLDSFNSTCCQLRSYYRARKTCFYPVWMGKQFRMIWNERNVDLKTYFSLSSLQSNINRITFNIIYTSLNLKCINKIFISKTLPFLTHKGFCCQNRTLGKIYILIYPTLCSTLLIMFASANKETRETNRISWTYLVS